MYFISFYPVDAVKPDDTHPEFTGQLANNSDDSARQEAAPEKNLRT